MIVCVPFLNLSLSPMKEHRNQHSTAQSHADKKHHTDMEWQLMQHHKSSKKFCSEREKQSHHQGQNPDAIGPTSHSRMPTAKDFVDPDQPKAEFTKESAGNAGSTEMHRLERTRKQGE
jgi:hypothetical protein